MVVLYDAPQDEVHTLAIGPDGILLAGTAEGGESTTGSSSRGKSTGANRAGHVPRPGGCRFGTDPPRVAARAGPSALVGLQPRRHGASEVRLPWRERGLLDRTRSRAAEIFRKRVLIYAMAWQGDPRRSGRVPRPVLYEVPGRAASRPRWPVDHSQILGLLAGPEGEVFLGVGDPGGVLRLEAGHARSGA